MMNTPGSQYVGDEFGSERKLTAFFSVDCGKLRYSLPDKSKGTCDMVTGALEAIKINWDEGNPSAKIKPGYRLLLILSSTLTDRDGTREPAKYIIEAHYPRTFTWVLASYIANVLVGQMIKLRVWAGSSDKVSVCMVEWKESDRWIKVARTPIDKDDEEGKHEEAEAIFRGHPAFEGDRMGYDVYEIESNRGKNQPVEQVSTSEASVKAQEPLDSQGFTKAIVNQSSQAQRAEPTKPVDPYPVDEDYPTDLKYTMVKERVPAMTDYAVPASALLIDRMTDEMSGWLQTGAVPELVNVVRLHMGLGETTLEGLKDISKGDATLCGYALRHGDKTAIRNETNKRLRARESTPAQPPQENDDYDPFAD